MGTRKGRNMLDIAQDRSSKGSSSSAIPEDTAEHEPEPVGKDDSGRARILLPTNPRHPMFEMGRDRRVVEREHEISSVMAGIVRRIVASK